MGTQKPGTSVDVYCSKRRKMVVGFRPSTQPTLLPSSLFGINQDFQLTKRV